MKHWIVSGIVGVSILAIFGGLLVPTPSPDYDLAAFGKLPVLCEGRVMPLDSVARQSALFITGKQTIQTPGKRLTSMEWLVLMVQRPQDADAIPQFKITHDELRSFLSLSPKSGSRIRFAELAPKWGLISQQALVAYEVKSEKRTVFQRNLLILHSQMWRYIQLKNSFWMDSVSNVNGDFGFFMTLIDDNRDRFRALDQGEFSPNDPKIISLMTYIQRFQAMNSIAYFWPVKDPKMADERAWMSMGQAVLFDTMRKGDIGVGKYVDMVDALRAQDPKRFNTRVLELTALANAKPAGYTPQRLTTEYYFHQIQPFLKATMVYGIVCLLVAIGWVFMTPQLHRSAAILLWVGFSVHTLGLLLRMYIQGRPPVTTLHSSAVFIGWLAVMLGAYLNKRLGVGLGLLIGAVIGFVTLIIAHQLSVSGDTMGVMQAVLDSNFWLATHVITITAGYSTAFLAGGLGALLIVYGLFKPGSGPLLQRLSGVIYGMVAVTLVLSFIGTVLGGIWADQSWGRFWGWDPKENGALLIVLWTLIILHLKKSKLIHHLGTAILAVLGNVVTAFSWFGVNLLGIGLHSYGFMEKGLVNLLVFFIVNLCIVFVAVVWRRRLRARIG